MQRYRAVSLSIVLLILPGAVFARTPYQYLQQQLDATDQITQRDAQDDAFEQRDAQDKAAGNLFTVFSGDDSGSILTMDATQKFVTVFENGVVIPLTDVPRQEWFAPYVRDVANRGIVSGYRNADGTLKGEFGPANGVSIAELAKMAVKTAGIDQTTCDSLSPLKNSSAKGDWSVPFIACGEKYHWSVYGDGKVDIHRPATRAEVVVTLLEAFEISSADVTVSGTFKDVTDKTPYASAVEKAVSLGIVSGYTDASGNKTGFFGPQKGINRAEVSKVLSLAIQKLTAQ